MKLFLFRRIEQVSENYHPEGGLVIVANDLEQAESLIASDEHIEPTGMEWTQAIIYELLPGQNYEPTFYTFPDAGCC